MTPILIYVNKLNIDIRFQLNIKYFPVHVNLKVILAKFL